MNAIDKNITDALKNQRPNDKVIKILSNKFAIVKSSFTDGTFDKPKICGLHNGIVYFYGALDYIKKYITNTIEPMQNEYTTTAYNTVNGGIRYKTKFVKHNRFKMQYRRILKLI